MNKMNILKFETIVFSKDINLRSYIDDASITEHPTHVIVKGIRTCSIGTPFMELMKRLATGLGINTLDMFVGGKGKNVEIKILKCSLVKE